MQSVDPAQVAPIFEAGVGVAKGLQGRVRGAEHHVPLCERRFELLEILRNRRTIDDRPLRLRGPTHRAEPSDQQRG